MPTLDRSNRWIAIGTAVAVGVLGGTGIAFGLSQTVPQGPSAQQLAVQVTQAQQAVAQTFEHLGDAEKVADFPEAASTAAPAAVDVKRNLAAVSAIDDDQQEQAVRAVLEPAAAILESAQRLDAVTGDDLSRWSSLHDELGDHVDALRSASAQAALMPELRVDGDVPDDAEEFLAGADKVVARGESKLTKWRKDVKEFKREYKAQRKRAGEYRGLVQGYLNQYAGTRTELQEWINSVESVGATFDEAYVVLASQKEKRQAVRSQIAAQTPPSALSGDHGRLLAVIEQAINAMDSAMAGIDQLGDMRDSYDYDTDYDETPSWQEFPAAVDAWTRASAKYVRQMRRGTPPKRPVI